MNPEGKRYSAVVGNKTVTIETVSAKEEPVDDAIFVLPADYKEMKMPTLPGGK